MSEAMPELYLETKPDANASMRRWEAWWQGEIADRPPVTIRIRPERPWILPSKRHASVRDAWLDVDFRVEHFAALVQQQEWFADCLPVLFPNLGPEVLASLFGAEIDYSEDTGWSVPCLAASREVVGRRPDWENPSWRAVERMIALSLEVGEGRWLTGYTDMHTNLDLLAALRDPQELCVECLEDPEGILEACAWVTPICLEAYERQVRPMLDAGLPTVTWLPAPAWGRQFVPSCDFNALIGPELFRSLAIPFLNEETRSMDRNVFHLDGPSALHHLEAVLEIPNLHALQWVYGAGNEPASRWIGVYRRALERGVSVHAICVDLEDAKRVMDALPPKGVWLDVGGVYDRPTAEAFLRDATRWATERG